MISIYNYTDVKKFLSDELDRRLTQNPKYSLRAFARDLGMSTSRISIFLRDHSPLTIRSAHIMADGLKLSDHEKEYFIQMVKFQFGKTSAIRNAAWKLLSRNHLKNTTFQHQKNNFSIILNEWYYTPLIEYVTAAKPRNYESIAQALGLSLEKITKALGELEKAGEIIQTKPGIWAKNFSISKFDSPIKSETIRNYHKSYLKKALVCIDQQAIEKRKYLTSIARVRKADIAEARQELETFNQNFIKKYSSLDMTDVVYCLSHQLYEMDGLS